MYFVKVELVLIQQKSIITLLIIILLLAFGRLTTKQLMNLFGRLTRRQLMSLIGRLTRRHLRSQQLFWQGLLIKTLTIVYRAPPSTSRRPSTRVTPCSDRTCTRQWRLYVMLRVRKSPGPCPLPALTCSAWTCHSPVATFPTVKRVKTCVVPVTRMK